MEAATAALNAPPGAGQSAHNVSHERESQANADVKSAGPNHGHGGAPAHRGDAPEVIFDFSEPAREVGERAGDAANAPDSAGLTEQVRVYNPSVSAERIHAAYDFAAAAHSAQIRKSGEPYITHPAQVAEILAELHLDEDSIITALLHDTVEDNDDVTLEQIRDHFGPTVEQLVDGVTKLTIAGKRGRRHAAINQAENLQKFVLAMSKDVRVLLVKLADRLHNMRTLHHVPKPESRRRKAEETLEIYAPLARRMGVHRVCGELEDLAFQHLSPSAYQSITRRLAEAREIRSAAVGEVSSVLTTALADAQIKASLLGREKRPYSIWRKLQQRALDFDDLADVYAFRIIVENTDDCYRALGLIHQRWRCVPARFKDYISTPKPNNYQSIHTTVMGPDNHRIELQIRSDAMDRIAQDGVAAHWKYKDQSYAYDKDAGFDALERLRPFVEILSHGADTDEFLEHTKLEMFSDQVFTFTPRGKVIPLPVGATPIDFAYALHTDIGDTCVGAKVNGRPRPLRTPLANGDVIEIVRSNMPGPPPGWQDSAVTGKAKSAIRRLVRRSQREEFVRVGRAIAEHAFRRDGIELETVKFDDAMTRLEYGDEDAMFCAIGEGHLTTAELLQAVYPGYVTGEDDAPRELISENKGALYVLGHDLTPGISVHFAPCCSPLPGERIVGAPSTNRGLDVHTIDCEVLASLEDQSDNWVDLAWSPAVNDAVARARILATVRHERGALAEITSAVSRSRGNITGLRILRRNTEFFDFTIDVEVETIRHLSHIIAAMRACPTVVSVERAAVADHGGSGRT